MSTDSENPSPQQPARRLHPFRRAVLRGLGIVLPPLLTIVLFIWAWTIIESYVLVPLEQGARRIIVWQISSDVLDRIPASVDAATIRRDPEDGREHFLFQSRVYVKLGNGTCVPEDYYAYFRQNKSAREPIPNNADEFFERYVELRYLQRQKVIPVFLCGFVLVLYLLGKFLAAGVGRIFWNSIEGLIHRLPVIRNVYSSVKQVTDFVFSEQAIEFNRVVAVEYPRKGIWSVGFVTGESMLDIRSAANEPVLTVLMPTSPMPATGFTITVRKSETIDLNITIDQAIQFIVSCGVVVPQHQQSKDNLPSTRLPEPLAAPAAGEPTQNGNSRPTGSRTRKESYRSDPLGES